jgi:carboxyl-terminal processing protease
MMENKEKKVSVYLPIIISIALVFGIIIGLSVSKQQQLNGSGILLYPKSDKLNNVLKYIEEEYVDTVIPGKLTDNAIITLLKGLDPHSIYIPAEEIQTINEPLEGNFSGIGVQFNIMNDTVVVISTIPNGPSALIGILPGDRIVKVNQVVVAGVKMNSEGIVKRLKGPEGTIVKVSIKRPGSKREVVYDIKRNKIPLYSIDVAYMLNDLTGYIKISQFARTTSEEFYNAIEKLKNKGIKKLVLDLRGNGGGYLDAAINLSNQFLNEGDLIVYTKGRSKPREDFKATAVGTCKDIELVVLIDEYSASASEIFAGAIQDNDRGLIIGRRSFGKGLVQEQAMLSDGSAIRLTVARYYTPTGRCIQKPYNHGEDDYFKDLSYRYLHGEFESRDSIHLNDSLKYKTPKGKTVYGGGGIMPDIFVPFDTTGFSKFYFEVRDMNLVYKFSFNYSDRNRTTLKTFTDLGAFVDYLEKEKIFDKFINYCNEQGIHPTNKDLKISGLLIKTQVEAYIARNFFDNNGFYPVIRQIDNTVDKAVEVLSLRSEN